jgi:hypothetical protein
MLCAEKIIDEWGFAPPERGGIASSAKAQPQAGTTTTSTTKTTNAPPIVPSAPQAEPAVQSQTAGSPTVRAQSIYQRGTCGLCGYLR